VVNLRTNSKSSIRKFKLSIIIIILFGPILASAYLSEKSEAYADQFSATNPPSLSKHASNITHAYDQNMNTSGNILKDGGYIIFNLADIGLTPGAKGTITLATSGMNFHTIIQEFLDENFAIKSTNEIIASRNKGDYIFTIHENTKYIKVHSAQNARLFIYEFTSGLITAPFGKGSSNLTQAYDGNLQTSANLLYQDSFMTYNLQDLGITSGTASITIATNGTETHTMKLEYRNMDYETVKATELTVNRNKGEYIVSIPTEASYLTLYGTPNAKIYIYEIAAGFPPTPFGKAASNLGHAYDGNLNTSANILKSDGFITYKLSDIGLIPSDTHTFTIGISNSETHRLSIDYLDEAMTVKETAELTVAGHKRDYRLSAPPDVYYLRINALPTAKVYLYEIGSGMLPVVEEPTKGTSNLTHGYDGNINTSANILTDDGYLFYNLSEIGLRAGAKTKMVIGTSSGLVHQLRFDFYNEAKVLMETKEITISGFKGEYAFDLHPEATFIKINAIPLSKVYLYELGEMTSPTQELNRGASNITHAYDGSITTSANVLTDGGFITYQLSEVSLSAGTETTMTIGKNNGDLQNLKVDYLDENLAVIGSSELAISGFKGEYRTTIHPNAMYMRLNGIPQAMVYYYELASPISEGLEPAQPELAKGASNIAHAYDGMDTTSGNILTDDGYIVYKLKEVGLVPETPISFIIGTSDHGNHLMKVDFLGADLQVLKSTELQVAGPKDQYQSEVIPAETTYIKIHGTSGAFLYIYEITKSEQ
jgi:hypothetical protein